MWLQLSIGTLMLRLVKNVTDHGSLRGPVLAILGDEPKRGVSNRHAHRGARSCLVASIQLEASP